MVASVTRCARSMNWYARLSRTRPSSSGSTLSVSPAAPSEITGSSSETKNTDEPGSPWRPARPRNWLSSRSVRCLPRPMTHRPPRSTTASRLDSSAPPRRMSVPRPAIWVETVTRPISPAPAMTWASSSSFFAFSTEDSMPRRTSASASRSDSATSRVPTRIGRPVPLSSTTSSISAANASSVVA